MILCDEKQPLFVRWVPNPCIDCKDFNGSDWKPLGGEAVLVSAQLGDVVTHCYSLYYLLPP